MFQPVWLVPRSLYCSDAIVGIFADYARIRQSKFNDIGKREDILT